MSICVLCHEEFPKARAQLGYRTCLKCGEKIAKKQTHTIVPMHKSNYVVITDNTLLKGINNKSLRG